ncbi:MAG: DUF2341 domain-containing protein, partial [Candidatus Diapherotrites archaeon]|nr:DUF2341 domain-containing protein [Candidatus Diapherotrites archaeon]
VNMYYGNSDTSSVGNGRDTFIVWDDFVGGEEQWTEVDSNGVITIDRTNGYVEFRSASVYRNNYVYMDMGSDIGNYRYDFDFKIIAQQTAAGWGGGATSDTLGGYMRNGNWGDGVFAGVYQNSSNLEYFFRYVSSDSTVTPLSENYNWTTNTMYYYSIIRNENEIITTVYSDSARTNILSTTSMPVTGFTNQRYVYAVTQTYAGVDSRYTTGQVHKTIIRKHTETDPTVIISGVETSSSIDWHLSGWVKRKVISINPTTEALTDFQVKKTIAFVEGMQPDFDDLRFTTINGTNIPYWIESKTDSVTADVWLKIPQTSTTESTRIWQYFENDAASSASSGTGVFDAFETFDSPTNWSMYNQSPSSAY